ncbi:MAG: metallophosphoesterase [Clostridia bacterium]|nr:metallophosphoesterase [Clostridia bacterium]
MKELKFFLITDTHYFKNSLGAYGEEYERFMDYEQKCFAETQSINEAVFDYLSKSNEADIILIAGDLSFNGEKESHKAFSAMLKDFKEKTGKAIYVVTAGHDANKNPFAFDDTGRLSPEGTAFEELYDYYRDFGYDQSIEFNREHMSYVAELSEDIRLLVICNDTAEGNNKEYDEEFLAWIRSQAQKAQADGKMMIAMEHYPVLAGQPLLNLIPDARQKGSKKLIETLADNGVHLIFTGHMHNQSINVTETQKGNKFYDVCTGSAIGCPAFMRLVTVKDESTVEIKSIPVPEFEWDKDGKTGEQYLQDQFDRMIRTMVSSVENDPERFCGKVGLKFKPAMDKPMRMLGRKISTVTLGTLGKLLFIKVDESIKSVKFADFAVNIVRSVFAGNQPYVEGTPEGDVILKLFRKIRPFVKTFKGSQGEVFDSYELLKHTVGNYGIDDYNAELNLK